jgi:hypothetical protein
MTANLVVHHIGARGETQAFPLLPAFDADVVNVLVDADKSSQAETQAVNSQRSARIITAPVCIAGANGPRAFHHTHCPYGSSLLSIDPAVGDLYVAPRWIDFDYTIKDALATARAEPVDAVTLDEMVAQSDGRIPLPDFLSLDTQGSELEILRGSPRCVASALAIVCEVEFVPLYAGQPLIDDVFAFMRANGFVFCGFSEILSGSYFRAPIGLRGKTCPVTTDALFLKRPDGVTDALELKKLALFALINGHIEFALWALSRVEGATDAFPRLTLESFDEQKAAPAPVDVRARFTARAKPDVAKLLAQSERLTDLLVRHGLGNVAEIQSSNLERIVTHFGLQPPASYHSPQERPANARSTSIGRLFAALATRCGR